MKYKNIKKNKKQEFLMINEKNLLFLKNLSFHIELFENGKVKKKVKKWRQKWLLLNVHTIRIDTLSW